MKPNKPSTRTVKRLIEIIKDNVTGGAFNSYGVKRVFIMPSIGGDHVRITKPAALELLELLDGDKEIEVWVEFGEVMYIG